MGYKAQGQWVDGLGHPHRVQVQEEGKHFLNDPLAAEVVVSVNQRNSLLWHFNVVQDMKPWPWEDFTDEDLA